MRLLLKGSLATCVGAGGFRILYSLVRGRLSALPSPFPALPLARTWLRSVIAICSVRRRAPLPLAFHVRSLPIPFVCGSIIRHLAPSLAYLCHTVASPAFSLFTAHVHEEGTAPLTFWVTRWREGPRRARGYGEFFAK